MKLVTLIALILFLSGCQDLLKDEDDPKSNKDLNLAYGWKKLDIYTGFYSHNFSANTSNELLIFQNLYSISTLDKSGNLTHYANDSFGSDKDFLNAVGPNFSAYPIPEYEELYFTSSIDPFDTYISRYPPAQGTSQSHFEIELGTPSRLIQPAFRSSAGPGQFGIFNQYDQFITLLETPATDKCYAMLINSEKNSETSYSEHTLTPIELPIDCIYASPRAIYATNGSDFFISPSINYGAFKVTSNGYVTKIFEDRVTNIFSLSNGDLFIQSDYDLFISKDNGENWNLMWQDTPSYKMNLFEIDKELYFFIQDHNIMKIEYSETEGKYYALDNIGLSEINSAISSIVEFNGRVYVTTLGDGIFYKELEYFDTLYQDERID